MSGEASNQGPPPPLEQSVLTDAAAQEQIAAKAAQLALSLRAEEAKRRLALNKAYFWIAIALMVIAGIAALCSTCKLWEAGERAFQGKNVAAEKLHLDFLVATMIFRGSFLGGLLALAGTMFRMAKSAVEPLPGQNASEQ